MPIETANYISDLVPTNPLISDNIADGPNHFWLIKKAIQNTFPNIKGAITASQDQLNTLMGLVGSSTSDGLDLKGNLTVEGKALVPSVTDWTTQQAVGAKDADGRYLKPGDADGRYLQLSTTNTQTVSGPVTFSGKLLTPNVDDFTSQEAIPAAQAEGRYIHSPNNPDSDYRILTISRNKGNGGLYVLSEDGSNTQLQPAGDYATNTALAQGLAGKQPVGNYVKTLPSDGTYSPVTTLQHNNQDGTLGVHYGDGSGWASYQPSGDYVTSDIYSSDFATSDSRVINLAWGHRIQAFETGKVNGGDWVTFPQSFSGRPQAIIVTPSKYIDVSNNIATYNWSSTGFNIEVVHQSDITFSVIAIGPK